MNIYFFVLLSSYVNRLDNHIGVVQFESVCVKDKKRVMAHTHSFIRMIVWVTPQFLDSKTRKE